MAAFEELYSRHFDSVYGYLRLMLGGAAEAEEAALEVFTRAFESSPAHQRNARPWLFSIARAAVVARGRPRDFIPDVGVSDPELMALIHELPALERDTVVFRHLLGLSVRESARALGCGRLAARRAHRRGLRTLQSRARGTAQGHAARHALLAGASPG
jgi:DNA-directed RNA polymerase specialized sigma24 family protein